MTPSRPDASAGVLITAVRLWSLAGFSLLILFALYRLTPHALAAFDQPLTITHWMILLIGIPLMIYSEGVKGFKQQFSPRFVQRTLSLDRSSAAIRLWLAPLYAMGYFAATRRRMLSSWLLTAMIIALVWLFHQLDQPLRGLLDAAVVAGLVTGLAFTWIEFHSQLHLASETPSS